MRVKLHKWICGCLAVILLHFLQSVYSYRYFAQRIPNGENVPHPCKPNELWEGVGHFNVDGGGNRNPFGQDFDAAGETWAKALCQKDSDGDGKTNGEELGDPDCTWTMNVQPKRTTGLSHPGVCEPLDSPKCQQTTYDIGVYRTQMEWMADACKSGEFVCAGLNDTQLKNFTLRIPPTPVPPTETTYLCAIFQFPENASDVHMVATTPILDNRYVMHHMVLFGCQDDVPLRDKPFVCGMSTEKCNNFLSIWTLGQGGECFHPNAGILLGAQGYKRFALQYHWNNPGEVTNYTDSSGMTLYYTTKKRPNNAEILMIGAVDFQIPPRQETFTVESRCTSGTTRALMKKPMYVTAAWNHMHYLGYSQKIEHFRNGSLLRNITFDEVYSYDSPKTVFYDTPVEVLPGDELKTTCHYKSTNRLKTTVWGEATSQEMCFGFLTMYPADAWIETQCTTVRSFSYSDPSTYNGCLNFAMFFTNFSATQLYANITQNCEFLGNCRVECKDAILEARKWEPCLTSGDTWEVIKTWGLRNNNIGINFLGSMSSCELEMSKDQMAATTTLRPVIVTDPTGSATTTAYSIILIAASFAMLGL